MKTGRYSRAKNDCLILVDRYRSPKKITKSLLLLSQIEKKISGFSRSYINNLKEIAVGFNETSINPSLLYLLGEFYSKKREYNRSYSAYRALRAKFPKSPEALMARKKLRYLAKYNPKIVPYLPDNETVNNTDPLDISPEIEIKKPVDKKNTIVYQ